VLIGAGLRAHREVLEAAEIDGATEWQKLRRVTIPCSRRVDGGFVTMVINVLKVFDIILNMARDPPKVRHHAGSFDLQRWLHGGIHSGVASAIAVILFLLVIPIMFWNLKKIKG